MHKLTFASVLVTVVIGRPAGAQDALRIPAHDRPLVMERTAVYEIGGIDGPAWAAFGGDLKVDFDAEGNLFVLDSHNQRVAIVDPGGTHLRDVGRRGGGPGEFQRPVDLAVMPDGKFIVNDTRRGKLIAFDSHGNLLGEHDALTADGMARDVVARPPLGVVADAAIYLLNGAPRARTSSGYTPIGHRPILRYEVSDDDVRTSTIHRARLIELPASTPNRTALTAFFPKFHMAALPGGGVVVSDTAAYVLTVLGSGGVERVLRRSAPRPPVSEAAKDAERERRLAELAAFSPPESVAGFGEGQPDRAAMEARFRRGIESMVFPDSFPAVQALRADAEGRIWVQRGHPPEVSGPIDLLTAEGLYLGTLPPGTEMPLAFGSDGLAVFLVLDALDVPTLHVDRVRITTP